jgi:hypothetical protein
MLIAIQAMGTGSRRASSSGASPPAHSIFKEKSEMQKRRKYTKY